MDQIDHRGESSQIKRLLAGGIAAADDDQGLLRNIGQAPSQVAQ